MKKSRIFFNYLTITILLLAFYSCSRQKEVKDIIDRAENIVEQQPDSALRLLNAVFFPEDLHNPWFNKYNLLLLQAKDKSDKNITSDTVIFTVKEYYVQKKDYSNAALAAFYCGRLWHECDNLDKAVEAYTEAEKWADKTGNYNLKGLIQGNLGILHREHSSYEKAIELNKNAVVMYDKTKNYKNQINALGLIGDCFVLCDKIDSALYYYNESLKMADLCNLPELQSNIKQSIGIAYREQGVYEQAKIFFNDALAFPNDSVERARILLNIAKVYVLEDNSDSINFYFDKALALQINSPWLMRSTYFLRSKIEENNNRYTEALYYHKEFYRYTVDVFDAEKNNKLLELQGKYDFEKLKIAKKELELKHQEVLSMLLLALLATCIVILVYYRKSAQNKRLLLETEQKIESLQKMASLFSKENSHTVRNILLDHFDILRKTALLTTVFNKDEQTSGQKLLSKFNEIVYGQDVLDWDKLYQLIDNLKDGFYSKVRRKYSQLNEMEFRITCLSCETDFSDKEIEIILGTTLNMVRRIRSDVRKKIGMSKGENFLIFFKNVIQ